MLQSGKKHTRVNPEAHAVVASHDILVALFIEQLE